MKTKKIKILSLLFVLLFIIPSFFVSSFKMGTINYSKHREIKRNIVAHPELLANKEMAQLTSFWFTNIRADLYRLEAIQYIGWNAISADYKKYLYSMIDIITHLNPYFEHPYVIWELLLPDYNERYENRTEEERKRNLEQAKAIWLKWMANFCDSKKIEAIGNEYDLSKLWSEEKYKDPCKSYIIPYYLAYIYYFYAKDPIKRALYYKITSANSDSLEWSKMLAAIMQGKWGDREKAIIMFLNMAKTVENNKLCQSYSSSLEEVLLGVFTWKYRLTWWFIKKVEENRILIDKALTNWSDLEQTALDDTKCISYINKSVREINLYYLEQANKKYKSEKWNNAKNAKILFDEWYIDYLPRDFQKSWTSIIIYKFNQDTWNFDYEMANWY